jgi:hypothetical protein
VTTDPIEDLSEPPLPAESVPFAPPPARDMAVFLILLALLDVSGLLHVYGLSSLYGEEFFFGLGALFVLLALGLALWPNQPVKWLRSQSSRNAVSIIAWGAVVAVLAALAIWQVLAAVERATSTSGVPVTTPISEQQKLVLIGLCAVVLLAFSTSYMRSEHGRRRWLMLAGAAWFGVAVWSLLFRIEALPGGIDWLARVGGVCAFMLVALGGVAIVGLMRPFSPGVFLIVALAVGGGLRLLAFSQLPININLNMGDMLPLVNVSTARFLDGHTPYYVYQMPYDLPLTYWPLNLFPYVPFRAWGLDLRLANMLFGFAVGGLLLWLRRSASGSEPGWACYAFGVLYLTPTMFTWDVVAAAPIFWLWLCVLMAVVVWNYVPDEQAWLVEEPSLLERARASLPGAALGAAFAAGPLVLPFAPFILVWWLRRGLRYVAWQVATAVIVGVVIVLPFLLADRDAFLLGAVSWFNDLGMLPRSQWELDRSWLYEVGLAGQVWKAGLEEWLKPMQLIVLGSMVAASWDRLRSPADVLRWGSAAYILFMALNPVIWPYLYTPALLGLIFTLAARGRNVAESRTVLSQSFTQQDPEVHLPEVVSSSQSTDDSSILHDDERNAGG